jgi:hypothetical protein
MVTARNKATAEKKRAFLAAFATCGTIFHAAHAAEIDRVTVYRWRGADPEFVTAMDNARETSTDVLEDSLYQRAVKGDTTAAIFLLKGRRRDVYGDKVVQEHTGTVIVDLVWPDGSPLT